jgi:hypothetical protein
MKRDLLRIFAAAKEKPSDNTEGFYIREIDSWNAWSSYFAVAPP